MIALGTMKQSDEQLVALAREGDGDAFGELWKRHRSKMINVARRYVSDENARDVVSAAFVKALDNIKSFAGKSTFSTWVFIITRHTALNVATKRTELPMSPIPMGEEAELAPEPADTRQDSPEEALIKKDVVERLAGEFKKLSPKQQEAIRLWREGWSYQEIADRLGCNRETVKTRVRDGKEKLCRGLKQQGVVYGTYFQ